MSNGVTNLDEETEAVFVLSGTASGAWVLKVEIESVKAPGGEKGDCGLDEGVSGGRRGQHLVHFCYSCVPSSHRQKSFHARVCRFYVVELDVPDCETSFSDHLRL